MHRNTHRALLASLAFVTLGALALTGCAPGQPQDGDSGPVTITYAFWDPNMGEAFQAAADAFTQENPDITVEIRQVPFASYFTKLNTQLESKSAPDVFWVQNIQFPLYAANGALADLTSYRDKSDTDLSGVAESALDAFVYDDATYAMPWQAITFGLYYNKKLFAEAGVAEPTNDWTWDDVAAAAAKLTNTATGVYGIVAPLWNYGNIYQTMYANGADIITDDGSDTDFDSSKAVEGIKYWTDLVAAGYSPTLAQLTDTSQDQWFLSGKTAMESTGSWNASVFTDALGEDVGVVGAPAGSEDVSGAALTANAVAASSTHIAEAYAWAEFLTSAAGQKIINETAGGAAGAPVNAEANEAWLTAVGTPSAQVFLDQLPRTKPLPATKNTAAWENELAPTLTPAWNGTATAEEVAKKMAEIIREKLAAE
ncbi:MAG: sugar ABC transporter substrate-binding protein [Microbacterium sp.]